MVNNKGPGVINVNILIIFFIGVEMFRPFVGRQKRKCNQPDSITFVKSLVERPSPIKAVLQSELVKEYTSAQSWARAISQGPFLTT